MELLDFVSYGSISLPTLNTASLTAPMDGDWSRIYLNVAGKTYTRWKKGEMPEDIRVNSLTNQQADDLIRLKDWLYRRRKSARQEVEWNERRQQKEGEATKRKAEQPALFRF